MAECLSPGYSTVNVGNPGPRTPTLDQCTPSSRLESRIAIRDDGCEDLRSYLNFLEGYACQVSMTIDDIVIMRILKIGDCTVGANEKSGIELESKLRNQNY